MSESELRFREQSFVNDSIRVANQRIQSSKTPHYEALHDPNLKYFFQSPVVLEVVRKTLNIDLDARSASPKKRRVREIFFKKKLNIFISNRIKLLKLIMESSRNIPRVMEN
jgi:hypothetical protein